MAQDVGIGMVSVKHSNHFGMSAWVVQQAIDAGMVSLVFTNSSPALPVWGGRSKLMGVSPIACGAPAGSGRPFIVDMAPSVAARGKTYKALRRGEKISKDWVLDKHGNQTDKPADVGHFLVSIKPDLFMGIDEFKSRMGHLYARVTGSEAMPGVERIFFPGEIELITKATRSQQGIPLVQAEVEALNKEAQRVGAACIALRPVKSVL